MVRALRGLSRPHKLLTGALRGRRALAYLDVDTRSPGPAFVAACVELSKLRLLRRGPLARRRLPRGLSGACVRRPALDLLPSFCQCAHFANDAFELWIEPRRWHVNGFDDRACGNVARRRWLLQLAGGAQFERLSLSA